MAAARPANGGRGGLSGRMAAMRIGGRGSALIGEGKTAEKKKSVILNSNIICGRCGKKGHIKRDCPAKCVRCGLQSCGGIKNKDRCMTFGGIPAGLAKIMSAEIKSKILARAKELGVTQRSGNANVCEGRDLAAKVHRRYLEGVQNR